MTQLVHLHESPQPPTESSVAELRPRPFISRTYLHPRDTILSLSLSLCLLFFSLSPSRIPIKDRDLPEPDRVISRVDTAFRRLYSVKYTARIVNLEDIFSHGPSECTCESFFCCRVANGLLQELRSVHERDLEEVGRGQKWAGRACSEQPKRVIDRGRKGRDSKARSRTYTTRNDKNLQERS